MMHCHPRRRISLPERPCRRDLAGETLPEKPCLRNLERRGPSLPLTLELAMDTVYSVVFE